MKKRDEEHLPRKENERIRQQIVKENRRNGTKRKNMVQEKPNRPSVGVPYRYRQKNAVFQAHGKLTESALVIALPKVQTNTWKNGRKRDHGSQKRVNGRELHRREDARPRIDARPKKVITRAHFIRLNDRKTTGEHAIGRKLLQSERARHAPV